ncbi:MAG: hypothetical protein E6G56_13035 [Actinobacteria bacterium]|nr:MAG: hypothetical protein E6G56_13035 [Actinomycetota bacterium]
MQTNDVTVERLRELARRSGNGKVLSVYVNLDPTQFATMGARSTEVTSVLDQAGRMIREADELSREERRDLRADLERLREFFGTDLAAKVRGAHGLAVFSSQTAVLFESLRLPRPVEQTVVIDSAPFIEPLASLGPADSWAVALLNRRDGCILRGSRDGFGEVESLSDDVPGWHHQGGWSQANYQRHIEQKAIEHVHRVCHALFARYQRQPFDHLVVAAPEELWPVVDDALHPYLKERLIGRLQTDILGAGAEQIHDAARPILLEHERRRERKALDRLAEGVGNGRRGAAGLPDVLDALTQRRVETLLVAESFHAPGVSCSSCGWLGTEVERCPVDGAAVQHRDDIVEAAVEAAVLQDSEVIFTRHFPDLGPLGSIGAVLRF